uniref:Actin like 7A n=2 Tax=Latimeria chalumnae TaxID=7897 RepID=H3A261_LATCH
MASRSSASTPKPVAITAVPQKGPAKLAKLVKVSAPERPSTPPNGGPDKTTKDATVHGCKIVKETRAVIIDVGTGYCKAGFAGQPRPSCIVSSTVGKHPQKSAKTGDNRKETFIGKEIQSRSDLIFECPLRHGIVTDWDSVQALWNYIFETEMKILPEEHAVLVSDPPLSPTTNREKYAELMFENFCIPAMYIAYQSVLALYSYGKTTGLVVDSGHGVSYVVPVHEGYNMPSITNRADYGGADLNNYLLKLLTEIGYRLTDRQLYIVEDIKKKCCYTSIDLEYDMSLKPSDYIVDYELPDGQLISLDKERFRCPEALFNPALIGFKEPGLHILAMSSINRCDAALKAEMFKNILLSGGSTLFDGFPERFQKEIHILAPHGNALISASSERKFAVWTGGSILASLKSFQQLWVRKREYDERGPFVIYRKC